MYIAQAYKFLHDWWRYLVGAIVIFLASQLGAIPLFIAATMKLMSEGGDISQLEDPNMIMTILESNLTLFLMLLSFAVGLFVLYFVVKWMHKQPFVTLTTSRKKTDWGRVWFGFILIAVTTVFFTGLDYYMNPQDYEIQFNLVPFVILAVIAIVMIPLQTSFEEYLFRGYLMQGIGVSSIRKYFAFIFIYLFISLSLYFYFSITYQISTFYHLLITVGIFGLLAVLIVSNLLEPMTQTNFYKNLRKRFNSKFSPLFVTSVIFGGLHFFNPEVEKLGPIIMIYYIGTGFFLGIITLMDEGMELALGFHAGNNLIAALLVTADWTVFQTNSILKDISEPSAGIDVLIPVLIFYPILIAIMAYRYKWKGWKDKLFGNVSPPPPVVETDPDSLLEL